MVPSTLQGKACWQQCEAAGHMVSTVKMDAVLSSQSLFNLDQDLGT